MAEEQNPIKNYLAPEWSTARVQIQDSQFQDEPDLTRIFNACYTVEPWDPTFHIVEEEELRQLVEKSLSETGLDRGFRLQCLRSISDRNLLGYFHLQHYSPRLPQPATVFISMFVIHPEYQGKQYGQEVVAGLADQLRECGYMAIWLHVCLKNWPALRFWVQQGFNKIIEYDGEKQLSESAHASLTLEKRLIDQ